MILLTLGLLVAPAYSAERDPFEDAIARAKALGGGAPLDSIKDAAETPPDATEADTLLPNSDLGIGLQGQVLLIEGAYYFGEARRDGVYFGHGRGDVQVGEAYAWAEMLHGGYAHQFSEAFSGGMGLRIFGQGAVALPYAEDETRIGPHAWGELGARQGIAARVQGGPGGLGVSVHWRWGDE